MPTLDKLQAALGGNDFEVVAVNIDKGGDDKAKAFLAEIGVAHLALYTDPSGKLFAALKAIGMPTTLLIDRQRQGDGPARGAGGLGFGGGSCADQGGDCRAQRQAANRRGHDARAGAPEPVTPYSAGTMAVLLQAIGDEAGLRVRPVAGIAPP